MTPLPDRTVILGLLATVALCFALVFWFVRISPGPERQPVEHVKPLLVRRLLPECGRGRWGAEGGGPRARLADQRRAGQTDQPQGSTEGRLATHAGLPKGGQTPRWTMPPAAC